MEVTKTAEIVIIMLSPTIVVGAVLYAPRAIHAMRNLAMRRHPDAALLPSHPPIEEIAADLRRLLQQYETDKRSTDVAMRAKRLRALEAALSDCALDAARALGVPHPARAPLTTPQLRQLLRSLADAGLMLPPAVGLLSADKRL